MQVEGLNDSALLPTDNTINLLPFPSNGLQAVCAFVWRLYNLV